MNKAAQAYFQTKVGTTDQGQLLLMLYDGALTFIQQARTKMIANDYAGKGILISKVIDIINELSASLNMDKGGSLAVNLNNLYLLCTARLLRANLKMDMDSLNSVESAGRQRHRHPPATPGHNDKISATHYPVNRYCGAALACAGGLWPQRHAACNPCG